MTQIDNDKDCEINLIEVNGKKLECKDIEKITAVPTLIK